MEIFSIFAASLVVSSSSAEPVSVDISVKERDRRGTHVQRYILIVVFANPGAHRSVGRYGDVPKINCANSSEQGGTRARSKSKFVQSASEGVVEGKAI